MSSESQKSNSNMDENEAGEPRIVEAVSWFDRARIRNRRTQMPFFRTEVNTGTANQDLASIAEQASKNVFNPTMQAKGWHMKTVQEDLAEAAHEGGLGIGQGKHGYEKPARNLSEFDGMKTPSLSGMPIIGRLFGLIQRNPRAATKLVTNHPISAGVFVAEVISTVTTPARYIGNQFDLRGKPVLKNQNDPRYWQPAQTTKQTRLVDLTEPVTSLTKEELASMDDFTRNLFQSKQVTPQQILALHDKLQAGQNVNLKSGPNAAGWMNRIMGDVGETLKNDAAKIGATNLIITLSKIGSVVASALGLATAVGMTGYGMSKINPSMDSMKNPTNQSTANPFAAPTSNDPSAAFGGSPTPAPAPTPFGAVSQNFGSLAPAVGAAPQQNGVGLMPSVRDPNPQAPPQQNGDAYGWTRMNSAAGRVLAAQNAQMSSPAGYAPAAAPTPDDTARWQQAVSSVLQGAPSSEEINAAFNKALALGDTPQGHDQLIGLLKHFSENYGPAIDRFDMMAGKAPYQASHG